MSDPPARPRRRGRLDRDGVPVDPNDWTVEDWRTLWMGMRAIKAKIAERHREPEGPRET